MEGQTPLCQRVATACPGIVSQKCTFRSKSLLALSRVRLTDHSLARLVLCLIRSVPFLFHNGMQKPLTLQGVRNSANQQMILRTCEAMGVQ
ncbi:unnamed protein product, partial [Effrenium voratum]